jgi:hypothetical protein
MKPGDDGGMEPLTSLFLRRRRRKQHPRRIAAAPSILNGIPTPSPIFWVFVSPSLLADGESGLDVALEVEDALLDAEIEDTALDRERLANDLVDVENVTTEDTVTDRLRDANAVDDCDALVRIEDGADGVAREDCHALVVLGHSHSLCVGVACASVVCDGTEGGAVFGPNS